MISTYIHTYIESIHAAGISWSRGRGRGDLISIYPMHDLPGSARTTHCPRRRTAHCHTSAPIDPAAAGTSKPWCAARSRAQWPLCPGLSRHGHPIRWARAPRAGQATPTVRAVCVITGKFLEAKPRPWVVWLLRSFGLSYERWVLSPAARAARVVCALVSIHQTTVALLLGYTLARSGGAREETKRGHLKGMKHQL